MKILYTLSIISLLFFSCRQKDQKNIGSVAKSDSLLSAVSSIKSNSKFNKDNEDFNIFLEDFSSSKEYQVSRIADTAMEYTYSDSDSSTVEKIDKHKWSFVELIHNSTLCQIYNNFDLKIDDTDERVFSIGLIESGAATRYYFSRINTKWYLVKRVIYLD